MDPHALPFTLRQLQYAVALRHTKSFRAAARVCGVSQPSLSAQISELESQLGVTVFERTSRQVLETQVGAELLDQAERVLLQAGDLLNMARQKQDPFSGSAKLGVIPTVGPYVLPSIDPALRDKFPRLDLRWVEDKTHVLVEKLEQGSLDAALLALEANIGDLEHAFVTKDPFLLAVSKQHPLSRSRRAVSMGELLGQPLLLLEDGHCLRDQALAFCAEGGARELGFRATSLSTLVQMTAGGSALTLLPKLALPIENRHQTLAIRPFKGTIPERTLVLAWRRRSSLAPALSQLAEVMREVLAANGPGLEPERVYRPKPPG